MGERENLSALLLRCEESREGWRGGEKSCALESERKKRAEEEEVGLLSGETTLVRCPPRFSRRTGHLHAARNSHAELITQLFFILFFVLCALFFFFVFPNVSFTTGSKDAQTGTGHDAQFRITCLGRRTLFFQVRSVILLLLVLLLVLRIADN
jgi:hypothetical protein